MKLPLNEWWLPVLAFIPIIVSLVKVARNKKVTKDSAFEFMIGLLVLLFSVNDNYSNRNDYNNTMNALTVIKDTLSDTRDSLLKIGLRVDAKTGALLVIDSQLLKKRFTQIINNNFISNSFSNSPHLKMFSILKDSQQVFFTPGSTSDIKLYRVVWNGIEQRPYLDYKVLAGMVKTVFKAHKEDTVTIYWYDK